MITLYVNWQDQETRRWFTVGRLSETDGRYEFVYTKGAEHAIKTGRFTPFGRLSDVNKRYLSEELFPLFSNRILSKSRPDYDTYLEWMDIKAEHEDPLEILSRSGGERATDNLQIYPKPELTEHNKYRAMFFVRGIRYLPKEVLPLVNGLKHGDELFPMHDMSNIHDGNAISLRSGDPSFMIGYCPRYLAEDLRSLHEHVGNELAITVKKYNSEAPLQMKVLCCVEAPWPKSFEPCNIDECQPIPRVIVKEKVWV